MNIHELLADPSNYTAMASRKISYIVIHYTGNNGDTAKGNCNYFTGAYREASAHYFVDENDIWRSVRDEDKAWHCGDDVYFHPYCRNTNSIGIELCSRKDSNGIYYFKPETVTNAVELTKLKMAQYNIPAECVVRHYDVTHKNCPAPFVQDAAAWAKFKELLITKEINDDMKIYQTLKDAPFWARPTLQKLIADGNLAGDGKGNINVSDDFCRIMTVLDRRGKL